MTHPSQYSFTYPSITAVIRNFTNGRRVCLAKGIPALRKCHREMPISYELVSISCCGEVYSFRLDDLEWRFEEVGNNTFKFIKHGEFIRHISKETVYKLISHYLKRHAVRVTNFRIENFPLVPDTISISKVDYLYFNLTDFPEVSTYFKSLQNFQTICCIDTHVNTPETEWVSMIARLNIDHVKITTIQRTPDDIFDDILTTELLEIKEEDMSDEKFRRMCNKFKSEEVFWRSSYTGVKWVRGDDLWDRLKRKFRVDRTEKEQFSVELDVPYVEMFVQRLPVLFYTLYSVQIREYEEKTPFQRQLSREVTEPLSRQISNVSTCLRSSWNTFFFTVAYFLTLIDSSFHRLPPSLHLPPLDPDEFYPPQIVRRHAFHYPVMFFIMHIIVNLVTFSLYFRTILEIHRRSLLTKRRGRVVFEFFAFACALAFLSAVTYFVPLLDSCEEGGLPFTILSFFLTLYLSLILETNRR